MATIQDLMKSVQPGRKVFVRAGDLGVSDDEFHAMALLWVEGKTDGFTVMGEPHYEKFVTPRRIDVVWLMRNPG